MTRPASCPRSARTAAPSPEAVPAVVLAEGGYGHEFDTLQPLLEEALGLPVVRVRTAGPSPVPSLFVEDGTLVVDGARVKPVVAWVRHSSAGTIYSHVVRTTGTAGFGLQGAECWSRLLDVLTTTAGVALPGRRPGFATQLIDASRHGARVPRTTVTTDVKDAMRRLCVAEAVVKIPDSRLLDHEADASYLRAPEIFHRDGMGVAWMDGTYPVVVQEHVEHLRELRVYYTDGGTCAFEVEKPRPGSIWTEPESVTVTHVRCPDDLAHLTQELSTVWGLRYGAYDFLITPSGESLFLEVNPDGDWTWFEHKAQWHGVSFMVGAMILDLYTRNANKDE